MKTIFLIVIICIVAFLGFGFYVGSTPEGKEKQAARDAISYCWSTQNKKSNSASQGQFIAGACEKMEDDFRVKYGVNP
ncbi:hypothetical protein [Citrobacter koseri]|uniref:hypothetical protein n=1 Tax=Citrobacter koseri TaxID=545 RepID=UPI001A297D9F|nr:hypothetical protein [Citrobacter koseri]HAU5608287.1 hypothetical protein [Citrobacter koseri]HDQ2585870.1 hypothetical protein [Citrobacter koseri]